MSLILTTLTLGLSSSAPSAAQEQPIVVRVATKPIEPFVWIEESDGTTELRGFSIDLWNALAERLGYETEWVTYDTVGEILDAARDGEVDAAIAGISMTAERETFIDFTHPYYDSGLQIVTTQAGNRSTLAVLWDVVSSRGVLLTFAALVALLLVIAHLVWWNERAHNPQFPHGYREGIGEALWWSSVSVITGGEAVKDINRPVSRAVALLWMVVGLFVLAFLTAQVASALTVEELASPIDGIEDLPGHTIVTVADTVAASYLDDRNLSYTGVPDVDIALDLVESGDADAVVYDAPVLAFRLATQRTGDLVLAGPVFAPDPYAIALPTGSDLREPINEALLELARDGTLDQLHSRWLATTR
ncbi:MAG: transporter substrate-binding domain-containing protein [Acidimicrobiales bacterium]|nr:transporter substrate-binding domain-containing protein [Acidimicrobiales bacterium]